MRIRDIYFERLIIEGDSFPYKGSQDFVQIIKNDVLAIEFHNGSSLILTLDNSQVEFGLGLIWVNKNDVLVPNKALSQSNSEIIKNIVDIDFRDIKYLYKTQDEREVVSTEPMIDSSLIGIKLCLSDSLSLYLYSAEPEMIDSNQFEVFREASCICILVEDTLSKKMVRQDNLEFPRTYRLR